MRPAETFYQKYVLDCMYSPFTKITYILSFAPISLEQFLRAIWGALSPRLQSSVQFRPIQSLSCVWIFATPWTAACQASLSITNSWSLLKLMSIESVMPSNQLILCGPLLLPSYFPATGSFQMSQFFTSGGQSIEVWASASILPMNIQDWFPLGWTGWTS